jgi:hypothetical protein
MEWPSPPAVQQVIALLAFNVAAEYVAARVEATGTLIDLRDAHLNQLDESNSKAALAKIGVNVSQRARAGRCYVMSVQTMGVHWGP